MKEITIIMEALSKMGEGAQIAFIWWCAKEAFGYFMGPVIFTVVGITVYKTATKCMEIDVKRYPAKLKE